MVFFNADFLFLLLWVFNILHELVMKSVEIFSSQRCNFRYDFLSSSIESTNRSDSRNSRASSPRFLCWMLVLDSDTTPRLLPFAGPCTTLWNPVTSMLYLSMMTIVVAVNSPCFYPD
ncbi:hypothetical protein KY289_036582 [Solanum tuberosum]|nr:hypothetical protein KY289_036582 [Solanum tuberosum]